MQYTWLLPPKEAFALSELLEGSVLFEDEKGMWRVDYFAPSEQESQWAKEWALYPPPQKNPVEDKNWVIYAQQALPPVSVDAFYIHSSAYPPSPTHRFSLTIEATMAFGSGHHETTQGCLSLLQHVWAHAPWKKAGEIGCGSGILTLAMNCLHPGSTWGSDCDPEAIPVAFRHALLNHISAEFFLWEGIPSQTEEVDLAVANIFSAVLIQWAPLWPSSVKQLILSGILHSQVADLCQAYPTFEVKKQWQGREWSTLWLVKQ